MDIGAGKLIISYLFFKLNLIKIMKYILSFACLLCIFLSACKKEKNTAPDYTEQLKNTQWFGQYRNKTESFNRGYAIVINADASFTFYSATVTIYGKWSVTGKTIRFKFDSGAQNEWTADIDNTTFTNLSIPSPDNFSFFNNAAKITGTTPAGYAGHTWTGVGTPLSQLKLYTNGMILDGGIGSYAAPAFTDKIFRVTEAGADVIVFVNGETAWVSLLNKATVIHTWREYKY
jgi:hypothetical protein